MRAPACIIAMLIALHCAWAKPVISNGSFERLDARGMPEDWEPLGDVSVTGRAHSGDRAVLLQRDGLEGETGLNRAWRPESGEQGKMLAQLRGGVSFRYMALEASDPRGLTFNIIPMSDEPLEVGGLRTTFVVPAEHVGDGRWHRGLIAYDYTDAPDVRWVQISPRLHGERAAMIIDSIEWVERIGPIATIGDLALDESPDAPGHLCTISTRIRSTGDEPLLDAEATLELPSGLAASDALTRSLGDLAPGEEVDARWEVQGARDRAARIGVSVEAQEVTASRRLEIAPKLEIAALLAAPGVLEQGGDAEVTVLLRNEGDAIVRGITCRPPRASAAFSAYPIATGACRAFSGGRGRAHVANRGDAPVSRRAPAGDSPRGQLRRAPQGA